MPQSKSRARYHRDPPNTRRDETEQERCEDEGGAPPGAAKGGEDGPRDGRLSQVRGEGSPLRGGEPSHEPDVVVDVPKVKVDEIYLDGKGMDAHVSLRAKLANLVQVTAGVHVHFDEVEFDLAGVEAEALMTVRLKNLYDIIDRVLTSIDRNPQLLEALLKTVDTAVDDTAETAGDGADVGPSEGHEADQVPSTLQDAHRLLRETDALLVQEVQGADKDGQQSAAGRREDATRQGSKRGTRRSGSSSSNDHQGERPRVVRRAARTGEVTPQALGSVSGTTTRGAAEQVTQQVRGTAGDAVQQVTEAATGAPEQGGEAAVKAAGQASWASEEQGRFSETETKSVSRRGRAHVRPPVEPV